jgi:hypothetical protein
VWDYGPARVLTSAVADVEARVPLFPYRRKCTPALFKASEYVTPSLRVVANDSSFAGLIHHR